jgi:hypothetical protein
LESPAERTEGSFQDEEDEVTAEQMIGAIEQLEAGRRAKGLARELAITGQTLYHWRAKNSDLNVNKAQRLRALEEENRRWKAPVADLSLDRETGEILNGPVGPPEVMKVRAGPSSPQTAWLGARRCAFSTER